MTINSRQKGARAEREIAKILREHGYKDARRGQQYCGTSGDADVVGLPGYHLEIKHVEKLNLESAWQQSVRDAKENEIPIVIHKKNRTPWKVTMSLDTFLKLVKGGDENNCNGAAVGDDQDESGRD